MSSNALSRVLQCGAMSLIFFLTTSSNPAHADIFGCKSRFASNPGSASPTAFFRLSDDGTTLTDPGTLTHLGEAIDVDGLAHSAEHGLLGFMLTPSDSTLVRINQSSGAVTVVDQVLTGRTIRGAAFDPHGTLWAFDGPAAELLEISPTTGEVVSVPVAISIELDPPQSSVPVDIVFDARGAAFISRWSPSNDGAETHWIYRFDPVTGDTEAIHTETGNRSIAGMAFARHDGETHLVTFDQQGADDIFRYRLCDDFSSELLFGNLVPSFNAGGGDLASSSPLLDTCSTDLTRDCTIDFDDVLALLAEWGPNGFSLADLDGDGSVGITDLVTVLADWGTCD